jgi:hypothetical protein
LASRWDGIFAHQRFDASTIGTTVMAGRTKLIRDQENQHEFCPTGEVRALSHYRLTRAVTLKLAWSAFAAGNLLFVDDDIQHQLPNVEVSRSNTGSLLVQDVFCGIEFLR